MSLPAMRAAVSSSLDETIAEARGQGVSVEAFSGALARAPARFLTSLSSMVCRFASFDLTRRLVGDRWYRFVRVKDERILVAEGEGFDMVIVPTDDPRYTVVVLASKFDEVSVTESSLSLFVREQIKAASGSRRPVSELLLPGFRLEKRNEGLSWLEG